MYRFQATAAALYLFTPKATGKGMQIFWRIYIIGLSWAIPFEGAHIQTPLISFLFFFTISNIDSNAN